MHQTMSPPEEMATSNSLRKRCDYIEWEDYFMGLAVLASKRSKDPKFQVGACIVKEKRIVGIGYNGMPTGCSDDEFPWGKDTTSPLDNKSLYVCHAEMNAILNKTLADLRDCAIYVSLFPCNECAKMIIQSGITEVVYLSDEKFSKTEYKAARRMFEAVGIKCIKFEPNQDKIEIEFSTNNNINLNNLTLN